MTTAIYAESPEPRATLTALLCPSCAARRSPIRPLTPEEDAIGDPDDLDDEVDDTLPSDLWF